MRVITSFSNSKFERQKTKGLNEVRKWYLEKGESHCKHFLFHNFAGPHFVVGFHARSTLLCSHEPGHLHGYWHLGLAGSHLRVLAPATPSPWCLSPDPCMTGSLSLNLLFSHAPVLLATLPFLCATHYFGLCPSLQGITIWHSLWFLVCCGSFHERICLSLSYIYLHYLESCITHNKCSVFECNEWMSYVLRELTNVTLFVKPSLTTTFKVVVHLQPSASPSPALFFSIKWRWHMLPSKIFNKWPSHFNESSIRLKAPMEQVLLFVLFSSLGQHIIGTQ